MAPHDSHDHSHDHAGHSHGHHHHGHSHSHAHEYSSVTAMKWGLALNLSFTLIEIVGGLWTGSVSILADAIHDLGDSIGLAGALYAERYSRKQRDREYSFGYRRFSLLSALLTGVVILSGSILVLREAIPRLWNPGEPHGKGMMALAVLGLAVNGAAALKLSRGRSQNERMLSWHFWEDTLGWGATLGAAILIQLWGWRLADPILAIGLSLFVARNVIRELRTTFRLFLQSVPVGFDAAALTQKLRAIEHVSDVHDLHVWSLDGASHVLSLHVAVAPQLSPTDAAKVAALKEAVRRVAQEFSIGHVTIETEWSGEACHASCD